MMKNLECFYIYFWSLYGEIHIFEILPQQPVYYTSILNYFFFFLEVACI